ncbi:hypothetical protein M1196_23295, partial [Salmonella enterica subsp. enterica serovar Oranienburg]|uniref:hypothetical protein n=1 Tax=Salmonella enterica TaxID=28901 RepID=UPI0021B229E4
ENWWEPNFDDLCDAMWAVYSDYEAYLPKAKHAAEVIADEYTWDNTATKLIDAIGRESMEMPDITEREWYEPTIQQFLVIPNKD